MDAPARRPELPEHDATMDSVLPVVPPIVEAATPKIFPLTLSFVSGGGHQSAHIARELERAYWHVVASEMRHRRTVFFAISAGAFVAVLVASILVGANINDLAVRAFGLVASVVTLGLLYLMSPSKGTFVTVFGFTALLVVVDTSLLFFSRAGIRDDALLIGIGGLPAVLALLGLKFILFAPVILLHGVYATIGLCMGPDTQMFAVRAIVFAVCVAVGTLVSYWAESRRRHNILLEWQLEHSRQRGLRSDEAQAQAVRQAEGSRMELVQFQRAMSYICHELRNPIHAMAGSMELIETGELDAAGLRSELSTLKQGLDIIVGITNDLLDLQMLRQGRLRISAKQTHIHDLIRNCGGLIRNAPVVVQIGDQVPEWALVDGLRLRQIVMNGLTNALKYAHPSPDRPIELVVDAEPADRGAYVELASDGAAAGGPRCLLKIDVLDRGPGLRGKTMEDLKTEFGSSSGSSGRSGYEIRSTGLGVPLSCRLTMLMGGSLYLADRTDGPGAKYSLRLPVMTGPAPPTVTPVPRTRTPEELKGKRILIVDDSASNRRIARQMLSRLGCVTAEVEDGDCVEEAVRSAAAGGAPFDAVLMDMLMDRMNGDVAAAALRKTDVGAALPLIAVTGNATPDDAQRYTEIGFNGLLPKPFNLARLYEALASVIGKVNS